MTKLVAMAASAALVTLASASFAADTMPSSGTTPYVTHFVFRPVTSLEVPASAPRHFSRRLGLPRT